MNEEKRSNRMFDLEKKINSSFSLDEVQHPNSLPFFWVRVFFFISTGLDGDDGK